jgi:hypothetical protein
MNRRTLTRMALLGLAIVTLPQTGVAQSDPLIGTWKLNLAKSTFNPGPAPKAGTLNIQSEGQGLRVINEGVDAQGNPTKTDRVQFLDAKSYPVPGEPAYDADSWKRVSGSSVEITRTKAGKVVQTLMGVASADGKTLTVTVTGINANGQQINNVVVNDKQ